MKVLFLDIDGVLNSIVWSFIGPPGQPMLFGGLPVDDIDNRSIDLLNILFTTVPDIKVVVSSSWRKIHSLDDLRGIFALCEFKGEIIDVTPNGTTGWRGEEVQMWVDQHPEVEMYACIDDGSDFHPYQNLVQTNSVEGITLKDVYNLLKIFDNNVETQTHQDLQQIFE